MRPGLKLLLLTLPLALTGAGFVAWTVATRPAPVQDTVAERAVAVRVIEARRLPVAPRASGFGRVTPARSWEAIAQVSGTAEYVNPLLKKGDILPEGALVVRLSDADYRLALAQARASIRAARARLDEIEVSRANQQAALAIEEEALALKRRELDRVERLYKGGTAAQSALDAARAAWLAQRQKVQGLKNALALLPTQRQVLIEEIAVQQSAEKAAMLSIERTELRLPFSGRVDQVSVEIGQLVRSGQMVARFDGVDAAEVEARIAAADLITLFRQLGRDPDGPVIDPTTLGKRLADLGLRARLVLKLGTESVAWPAMMDRISNTIDPETGTVGVILRVEDPYADARLGVRPPLTRGMFVEGVLEGRLDPAIAVPRSALHDGRVAVVGEDGRLLWRPVRVAYFRDRLAVLAEGVEVGERVVVSRPVPMVEGMLLDPRPDRQLMAEIAGTEAAR